MSWLIVTLTLVKHRSEIRLLRRILGKAQLHIQDTGLCFSLRYVGKCIAMGIHNSSSWLLLDMSLQYSSDAKQWSMLYRNRQEVSKCRCVAALSACLELLPERDIEFPWAPNQNSKQGKGVTPAVEENYLTWTTECGKQAQVSMRIASASSVCIMRYQQGS